MMVTFNRTFVVSVLLSVLLVGCGGKILPKKEEAINQAASSEEVKPQLPKPDEKEHQTTLQVIQLLNKADIAYSANKLTTPVEDNAVRYYRKALMLDPGNQEALTGIENVVNRYLSWVSNYRQKGDLTLAKLYLRRAEKVSPYSPGMVRARQQLKQAELAQNATAESVKSQTGAPQHLNDKTTDTGNVNPENNAAKSDSISPLETVVSVTQPGMYEINSKHLKQKSIKLVSELGLIADEIFDQRARVQIEAPSERLGRWIYQQLNSRNENFRVRAHLKIAKIASIKLIK